MNHRFIVMIATEEQEKAMLPHIQGAIATARDIDLKSINLEDLRRKGTIMAIEVAERIRVERDKK